MSFDEAETSNAIGTFLRLQSKDRQVAGKYIFANYLEMARQVDEDDLGCRIESEEDIWKQVHPSEIFVSRCHRHDRAIYIQVTAECDWEREHGLQIDFQRGGELSRVSSQDGHLTRTDAFNLPEDQDRIDS